MELTPVIQTRFFEKPMILTKTILENCKEQESESSARFLKILQDPEMEIEEELPLHNKPIKIR